MIPNSPWVIFAICVAVMVACCYLAVKVLRPRSPKDRHPYSEKASNIRPAHGPCPGCDAEQEEFCRPGCNRIDPGDWRG